MNESDWLAAESPYKLFNYAKTGLSARKKQLVACGCCRLLDPFLTDAQRDALGLVERHADGLATDDDFERAKELFLRGVNSLLFTTPTGESIPPTLEAAIAAALLGVVSLPNDYGLRKVIEEVEAAGAREAGRGGAMAVRKEMARRMCGVFHEVVGNPFIERRVAGPERFANGQRPPAWMLKVGETARGIAVGVQADQAFDRLPILADALEDDGCTDTEFLTHLRHHSHHLRGCWALDLVLGKQ